MLCAQRLKLALGPRGTKKGSPSAVSKAEPSSDNTQPLGSREIIRWLWTNFLSKHVWLLVGAVVLMSIEGSMLGALSWMMQPMFDGIFVNGDTGAIWLVGTFVFFIFVTRAFSAVGQQVLLTFISQRTAAELRTRLLERLMRLDNSFHQEHPPGYLIQRLQADVLTINTVWRIIITGAGRDAISLVVLLGVAVSVDWRWTLVACIGTPIRLSVPNR